MRISDWSSDVCSSDLICGELRESGLMDTLPGKGEVMIQMIVSLYRAIIGVLFVVGLVATFALAAQGGAGLIMGLGIVLFMVMALGISAVRSEEHTSELQSLMRISYAVFCLKKKKHPIRPIPLRKTPPSNTTTPLINYHTHSDNMLKLK